MLIIIGHGSRKFYYPKTVSSTSTDDKVDSPVFEINLNGEFMRLKIKSHKIKLYNIFGLNEENLLYYCLLRKLSEEFIGQKICYKLQIRVLLFFLILSTNCSFVDISYPLTRCFFLRKKRNIDGKEQDYF